MELVFFSWRRTAVMLALRVKLKEETDGKGEEKKKLSEGNIDGRKLRWMTEYRYYGLNRGLGRRNEVGRTESWNRRDEGKRRC